MKLLQKIWYFCFWVYLKFTLNFFYKKIKISGKENIPKTGATIFAINHENALLDPLLVTTIIPRVCYYLVRADVFKNKIANFFLRSLYLMPVYRMRDGIGNMKENQAVFKECYEVLNRQKAIMIFPEGEHDARRIKRNRLKKGICRIALGALSQADGPEELHIVPVGMDYSAHDNFRSKVHITFGEAIAVEKKPEDDPIVINELKAKIETALSQLHVSFDRNDYKIMDAIFFHDHKPNSIIDAKTINSEAQLVNEMITEEEKETIATLVDQLNANGIKLPVIRKESIMAEYAKLALLLPFSIYGFLTSLPAILVGDYLARNSKDRMFVATLRYAGGYVFSIGTWLGLAFLFHNFGMSDYFLGLAILGFPLTLLCFHHFVSKLEVIRINKLINSSSQISNRYAELVTICNNIRSKAKEQS